MAKTARKGKLKKFAFDNLYPIINALCIVFSVANFLVIFLFERSKAPKIERIYETVTTNHVIVVTNVLESSGQIASSVSVPAAPAILPDLEIPVKYKYFMVDGTRHIEYCGRYFSEGSPTSYGRISLIFPDRIVLDNGRYLKNTAHDVSPLNLEVGKNDGV